MPEHWDQSLWRLVQGREQVRVEQRGQRYFGGLMWLDQVAGLVLELVVVEMVEEATILSRARSVEGLSCPLSGLRVDIVEKLRWDFW